MQTDSFKISIGNLGVHLPDTTAFVFWPPPGCHTELIDSIFVGKNKSSMNLLSFSSASTNQIFPVNLL